MTVLTSSEKKPKSVVVQQDSCSHRDQGCGLRYLFSNMLLSWVRRLLLVAPASAGHDGRRVANPSQPGLRCETLSPEYGVTRA